MLFRSSIARLMPFRSTRAHFDAFQKQRSSNCSKHAMANVFFLDNPMVFGNFVFLSQLSTHIFPAGFSDLTRPLVDSKLTRMVSKPSWHHKANPP